MAEALTLKKLQEQINLLRDEIISLKGNAKNTRLIPSGLKVGDKFELIGLTWTILDITDEGYKCLADRLEDGMKFDAKTNDWKSSSLRNYLNTDFYNKLADEIGGNNVIPFESDLTSLDGQTEYGFCEDKVSLLSIDEYRTYRKHIPNADYWWWLINPYSTPCNGYKESVTVVSSSGGVGRHDCYGNDGVRPFCIFSSSIFESEE